MRLIDPRDVGSAAAAILTQPTAGLAVFIAKRNIEVHGPAPANFADKAAALSAAVGYDIKIKQVPLEAWVQAMQGYGLPRVWATSFAETVLQADGVVPPGYPAPKAGEPSMGSLDTSPELLAIWKPQFTVQDWASSAEVKAAFARS